jgi:hypothetical protein
MQQYLSIIRETNQSIKRFNEYLQSDYQVVLFDEKNFKDDRFFLKIITGYDEWWKQTWPNSNKAGVYFLLGFQKNNPEKYGVYIGKASLGSKIGNRLYSHLIQFREAKDFEINDAYGNQFILDYVTSIELENKNMIAFAPALEEFLISDLKDKVNLINSRGNT